MISSKKFFPNVQNDITLFAHQIDAITWLQKMDREGKGVILADSMGLGKTRTTSFFLETVPKDKILISCPKSVVYAWIRELLTTAPSYYVFYGTSNTINQALIAHDGKIVLGPTYNTEVFNFFPERPKIMVCTFNAVTPIPAVSREVELNDLEHYGPNLIPFNTVEWDRFILDEAHTLRNGVTESFDDSNPRNKTLKYYRMSRVRMAPGGIRIGLTGTPIQNRISDITSLLRWVKYVFPGKPDISSVYKAIEERVFRRTEKNLHPHLLHLIGFPTLPYTNNIIEVAYKTEAEREFYEVVSASILRTSTNRFIASQYQGLQSEETELVRLNFLRYLSANANMFLRIYNTRHGTNYPPWRGSESKMDMIGDKILELAKQNESIIIFIHFDEEKDLIIQKIKSYDSAGYGYYLGYRIYFLNGKTKIEDRELIIFRTKQDQQNGQKFLIIANVQSSSEGINLQHAHIVIFSTPDWNPSAEEQALARTYRIGQKSQVQVFRYIHSFVNEEETKKHIDLFMKDIQERKNGIVNSFVTEAVNAAYLWPSIEMPGYPGQTAVSFNNSNDFIRTKRLEKFGK